MVAELELLSEWIPDQMQPGTIFVLENAGHIGEKEDPYWAVLSCPSCGTLGLITRKQIAGLIAVMCGSGKCSAQFFIRDNDIEIRASWTPLEDNLEPHLSAWCALLASTAGLPPPGVAALPARRGLTHD